MADQPCKLKVYRKYILFDQKEKPETHLKVSHHRINPRMLMYLHSSMSLDSHCFALKVGLNINLA